MGSPSLARRQKEKSALRQNILDAAREILLAEGTEAVSMRRIAERIQYSATAIYLHFKDKDELLAELMAHDFLQLGHAMAKVADVADPIERLRAVAWIYLRFGIENPHHYRVMFMTPLTPEQHAKHESSGLVTKGAPDQDAYAMLQAVVQLAIDAGRVRTDIGSVDVVAQVCWSAIHGIISLHIAKAGSTWCNWQGPEAIAERSIEALLAWLIRS